MSDFYAGSNREDEMINELIVEGFGDPLPTRCGPRLANRVTIASQVTVIVASGNKVDGEIPEGVPFEVEGLEVPATNIALWRFQLNDYVVTLCT